jgi:hypothetical protein
MQQAFYTVGSMCKTLLAENATCPEMHFFPCHATPSVFRLGHGSCFKDLAILWQAKLLLAKQNP